MNKRVTATLLALLLAAGLACTPALAEGAPAPSADSGGADQTLSAELGQDLERPPAPVPEPSHTPQEGGGGAFSPPPLEDGAPPTESAFPPPEVTPPPTELGCNTVAELAARLAQDGGGTVAVTGELTLDEGADLYLEVQTTVTVDLGPYGIMVPEGASLTLRGPITLVGSGAPRPLVAVSGFLTTEDGAALSASGEGAVAVRLTGGGWRANVASVRAVGAHARAVEATDAEQMDLYRVHLTASGADSLCVRSTGPVRLILCRAESEGALVDAPALTLDGTAASPEPEDAHIVRRVAVPHDSLSLNGLWLEAGAPAGELDALLDQWLYSAEFEYGLVDEAGVEPDLYHVTTMTWTGGDVDRNTPGVYWFTGLPDDWAMGCVAPPEKRIPVHVADPDRPAIQAGYRLDSGAELVFFRPIREAQRLSLWYSADEGATWRDAGALPEAELGPEGAHLPQLPEADRDYLFRMEVEGGPMAGRTNTLRFLYYDNLWGWGSGGDWDGGDWGDQGPLPDDDPAPPPDREPDGGAAPPPEPDDRPPEPDREDGGGGPAPDREPEPSRETEERPERPAVPTPSPTPGPPDIEVSFVEPLPAPEPTPAPPPEEAAPTVEPVPPASPASAATPAPASEPPQPVPCPHRPPCRRGPRPP